MTDAGGWREKVRPLTAAVGLTSSRFLWQSMALRAYRAKLARHSAYRTWVETEASRWVAPHWGHGRVEDQFETTHLASQLYEITELLRRRIGRTDGTSLLDAGASDGFFLARIGVRAGVGVNLLMGCAQRIHSDGYPACAADIEALPFADKSFDYVLCCETLEHVLSPIRTLNELARVCRKRICLTIPWLPRTRINARPDGWPEVESHVFEFSEADFAKVISFARVRLVYRDRVQVFPRPRNPFVRWWLGRWMYPHYFPMLQYYELEPA